MSVSNGPNLVKGYDYFEALRRPFLSLSPNTRWNSTIANQFLELVRAGQSHPTRIVDTVQARAGQKMNRQGAWGTGQLDDWLYFACKPDEHQAEALLMARWAVEWNSLPKRDRDRIKYQQSRPYVEAWNEGFYAWNQLLNEQAGQA